tara:strand:- start:3214 stop:3474 length:261 start_codon:yes stop_codon:yes gene_type:complete
MLEDKNKKFKDHIFDRMWVLSGSLRGVGALLQQQSSSNCYDHDELFGLGQFLKLSSEEIIKLEDILRCGRDSVLDDALKNENDDEE